MKLLTFDPKKKKTVLVGEIRGIFLYRTASENHFMHVSQSYAIQEVAFQDAISKDVQQIVEEETNTGYKWVASIDVWKEHGKIAEYSGHGKQRFLGIKFMKKFTSKPNADTKPTINYDIWKRLGEEFKKKYGRK